MGSTRTTLARCPGALLPSAPPLRALLLGGLLLGGGAGCSSADESPSAAEQQAQIDHQRWWSSFLSDAPEWPEHREQWLSRGPRDRDRLLELLLFELVRGNQADQGPGFPAPPWKRCGKELRYLGSDAVRPLVQSLQVLLEREPRDWVSIDRLAQALGGVAEAEEVVAELLPEGADVDQRRTSVKVLIAMESPSAVAVLVELAREDPDWQIRGTAMEGLSPWAPRVGLGDVSAFSRDALVDGLRDPDPFVQRKAAEGLARTRLPAVRYALVDCLGRAKSEGDTRLAEVVQASLEANLQRSGPEDVAGWLRLIEDGGA